MKLIWKCVYLQILKCTLHDTHTCTCTRYVDIILLQINIHIHVYDM